MYRGINPMLHIFDRFFQNFMISGRTAAFIDKPQIIQRRCMGPAGDKGGRLLWDNTGKEPGSFLSMFYPMEKTLQPG